jgi:hypothetical protein
MLPNVAGIRQHKNENRKKRNEKGKKGKGKNKRKKTLGVCTVRYLLILVLAEEARRKTTSS